MAFAFVFPGQGSQSVGMLGALAAAEPAVRATFDEA
jgi:[acyl-carrier-protein] S-malonyltransferase